MHPRTWYGGHFAAKLLLVTQRDALTCGSTAPIKSRGLGNYILQHRSESRLYALLVVMSEWVTYQLHCDEVKVVAGCRTVFA